MRRVELLERIREFPVRSFSDTVFRATRTGLAPDVASTSGGRWMPANRSSVLYTSLTRDGALSEMAYRQSLLNPIPTKPLMLHQIAVSLQRVVRLTLDDLRSLGVDDENYHAPNYARTQEIGDAVWFLECEGLVVPSARFGCDNLAIFTDRIAAAMGAIEVKQSDETDWIAWAKAHGIQFPIAE
ncbi:MAG: RES family NAD+ phosphorylase [Burkholderiales bacterium]